MDQYIGISFLVGVVRWVRVMIGGIVPCRRMCMERYCFVGGDDGNGGWAVPVPKVDKIQRVFCFV
jgi:hypothetical protein